LRYTVACARRRGAWAMDRSVLADAMHPQTTIDAQGAAQLHDAANLSSITTTQSSVTVIARAQPEAAGTLPESPHRSTPRDAPGAQTPRLRSAHSTWGRLLTFELEGGLWRSGDTSAPLQIQVSGTPKRL
jgi:hypothetical protein